MINELNRPVGGSIGRCCPVFHSRGRHARFLAIATSAMLLLQRFERQFTPPVLAAWPSRVIAAKLRLCPR